MALPAATDFTGSNITEAQFKTAITDFRNYVATMETVAPGIVAFYPKTTAPAGWLKANGAAISRTTYSALFAAIGTAFGAGDGLTTFNVPDLRGEFLRGLDDGKGTDPGRTLSATVQDDALKSHTHTLPFKPTGIAGAISTRADVNSRVTSGTTESTNATGGTETRPRNIALLACIKY